MEQQTTVIKYRGVKSSVLAFAVLAAFAVGVVVGMALRKTYWPTIEVPTTVIERDTVVYRDTVAGAPPAPVVEYRIRYDTVRVKLSPQTKPKTPTGPLTPDTTRTDSTEPEIAVPVPITSKVYRTEDYRAVVSGFNPSLDSMQVYRRTERVTETITKIHVEKPRWSLTAGVGGGYAADGRIVPHIGVTAGFVLWSK